LVFEKLKAVNLKFNLGKCCFGAKEITFWGHVVDQQGSRPNPTKVQVVFGLPRPVLVTNVKTFLGFMGYYRVFIREYATTAGPLFELTKKDTTLEF
jgi:hypothetical protein